MSKIETLEEIAMKKCGDLCKEYIKDISNLKEDMYRHCIDKCIKKMEREREQEKEVIIVDLFTN
jgi:hypothetical protein